MKIQLSDHFTLQRLLCFVFPSILMMIFTSIYGVVDGLFVSNFVGKTAFAAVNLIMPVLMGLGALGFMIGTGGSALVSLTLGLGEKKRANCLFSMLIYVTIGAGILLTVVGLIWLRPIAAALGASGAMLEDCVLYGRIILAAQTMYMLQNVFQSFFVTAEKPHLGLAVTVAAGVTNMVLDFLFVAVLPWGLAGAAVATAASQVVGGLVPLLYFSRPQNSSLLRLTRAKLDLRALGKTCSNGSSELMTNLSLSLVNILYNFQLLRMVGEDGVAAYGVIMYVNFIFISIFLGYSIGSAPIIGFHYGAAHREELQGLFRKSLALMGGGGALLTAIAVTLAHPLAMIFVGYDADLLALTARGLRLYSISFLFVGFNIFASAFFTALNDGVVSACISFLRTLLFQTAAVLLLPILVGVDGIWLAIVAAEVVALGVSVFFLVRKKNTYHYA
jgi:putative MATE family efflux protein